MSDNKVEDKKEKAKALTVQEFAEEYKKLCQKMGFQVVAFPAWIARDDGSFSLVIQYSAGKTPQQK